MYIIIFTSCPFLILSVSRSVSDKMKNATILLISYLLLEALPVSRSVSGETSNRQTLCRGSAPGRWIPIRLCRECALLPSLAERSIGRKKTATSFPQGGSRSTIRNHDASSLFCYKLVGVRRCRRWRARVQILTQRSNVRLFVNLSKIHKGRLTLSRSEP